MSSAEPRAAGGAAAGGATPASSAEPRAAGSTAAAGARALPEGAYPEHLDWSNLEPQYLTAQQVDALLESMPSLAGEVLEGLRRGLLGLPISQLSDVFSALSFGYLPEDLLEQDVPAGFGLSAGGTAQWHFDVPCFDMAADDVASVSSVCTSVLEVACTDLNFSVGDGPELDWMYLDSLGDEYGPVPACSMRDWFEHGFFGTDPFDYLADMPIRVAHWKFFAPVRACFPNIKMAFVGPPAIDEPKNESIFGIVPGDTVSNMQRAWQEPLDPLVLAFCQRVQGGPRSLEPQDHAVLSFLRRMSTDRPNALEPQVLASSFDGCRAIDEPEMDERPRKRFSARSRRARRGRR